MTKEFRLCSSQMPYQQLLQTIEWPYNLKNLKFKVDNLALNCKIYTLIDVLIILTLEMK